MQKTTHQQLFTGGIEVTYTKEELDALWQANLERKEEIVKKYRQEHPEILRGYRGSIDTPEMRAVREEEKRLYGEYCKLKNKP